MAITDRQGGLLRFNRAYEEIWGGPRPATREVSDYAAYQACWVETGAPVEFGQPLFVIEPGS